ncbi:hypothetical protein MAHJHV59_50020 [Mycobacterium avium subsp. hominissuis]
MYSGPGAGSFVAAATARPARLDRAIWLNTPSSPAIAAAPAAMAGEEGVFSQMALSSLAGRAVAAAATRPVGGAASAATPPRELAAEADPAAATIIVIPCIEE